MTSAADSSLMSPTAQVSTCRYCRSYQVEGRRGGHCNKLNVTVQSRWSACSLAEPTFMRKLVPEASFAAEALMAEALFEANLVPLAIDTTMADDRTAMLQRVESY
jgi:hypothetical protein